MSLGNVSEFRPSDTPEGEGLDRLSMATLHALTESIVMEGDVCDWEEGDRLAVSRYGPLYCEDDDPDDPGSGEYVLISAGSSGFEDPEGCEDGQEIRLTYNLDEARVVASCPDNTPDDLVLADITDANLDTRYESAIVQVTGIDIPSPVSISGGGNPKYRLCRDSGCGDVTAAWTNGAGTVAPGAWFQLRMDSAATFGETHTAALVVGTQNLSWNVTTSGWDCDGCYETGGDYYANSEEMFGEFRRDHLADNTCYGAQGGEVDRRCLRRSPSHSRTGEFNTRGFGRCDDRGCGWTCNGNGDLRFYADRGYEPGDTNCWRRFRF